MSFSMVEIRAWRSWAEECEPAYTDRIKPA